MNWALHELLRGGVGLLQHDSYKRMLDFCHRAFPQTGGSSSFLDPAGVLAHEWIDALREKLGDRTSITVNVFSEAAWLGLDVGQ